MPKHRILRDSLTFNSFSEKSPCEGSAYRIADCIMAHLGKAFCIFTACGAPHCVCHKPLTMYSLCVALNPCADWHPDCDGFADLFARHFARTPHTQPLKIMLGWTITFLVLAIIAGLLGFVVVAGAAAEIAKILFFIFLILLVVSALSRALKGKTP